MRRTILALAAACESLGLRAMDAGLRIVDAAAWVRDHVDPKRHSDAAVNERERMDADREAVPPPIDHAALLAAKQIARAEVRNARVTVEPCRCRQVGCPVCDPPCLN